MWIYKLNFITIFVDISMKIHIAQLHNDLNLPCLVELVSFDQRWTIFSLIKVRATLCFE